MSDIDGIPPRFCQFIKASNKRLAISHECFQSSMDNKVKGVYEGKLFVKNVSMDEANTSFMRGRVRPLSGTFDSGRILINCKKIYMTESMRQTDDFL